MRSTCVAWTLARCDWGICMPSSVASADSLHQRHVSRASRMLSCNAGGQGQLLHFLTCIRGRSVHSIDDSCLLASL